MGVEDSRHRPNGCGSRGSRRIPWAPRASPKRWRAPCRLTPTARPTRAQLAPSTRRCATAASISASSPSTTRRASARAAASSSRRTSASVTRAAARQTTSWSRPRPTTPSRRTRGASRPVAARDPTPIPNAAPADVDGAGRPTAVSGSAHDPPRADNPPPRRGSRAHDSWHSRQGRLSLIARKDPVHGWDSVARGSSSPQRGPAIAGLGRR